MKSSQSTQNGKEGPFLVIDETNLAILQPEQSVEGAMALHISVGSISSLPFLFSFFGEEAPGPTFCHGFRLNLAALCSNTQGSSWMQQYGIVRKSLASGIWLSPWESWLYNSLTLSYWEDFWCVSQFSHLWYVMCTVMRVPFAVLLFTISGKSPGWLQGHFLQAHKPGGTRCSCFQILPVQVKKEQRRRAAWGGPALQTCPSSLVLTGAWSSIRVFSPPSWGHTSISGGWLCSLRRCEGLSLLFSLLCWIQESISPLLPHLSLGICKSQSAKKILSNLLLEVCLWANFLIDFALSASSMPLWSFRHASLFSPGWK